MMYRGKFRKIAHLNRFVRSPWFLLLPSTMTCNDSCDRAAPWSLATWQANSPGITTHRARKQVALSIRCKLSAEYSRTQKKIVRPRGERTHYTREVPPETWFFSGCCRDATGSIFGVSKLAGYSVFNGPARPRIRSCRRELAIRLRASRLTTFIVKSLSEPSSLENSRPLVSLECVDYHGWRGCQRARDRRASKPKTSVMGKMT
jgi:hypothetical protein